MRARENISTIILNEKEMKEFQNNKIPSIDLFFFF